jgi:hypothetical protein
MLPDIEQHIELMSAISLLIVVALHRLLKRKRLGNLRLTVSVTEENSSDCPQNTNLSEVDGVKTDSNDVKPPHTEQHERQ